MSHTRQFSRRKRMLWHAASYAWSYFFTFISTPARFDNNSQNSGFNFSSVVKHVML